MTNDSRAQHEVIVTLLTVALPSRRWSGPTSRTRAVHFRKRGAALEDGEPSPRNAPLQMAWVAITSLHGSRPRRLRLDRLADGAARTASAAARARTRWASRPTPAKALQIQVIAQQWVWTFRYPAYGGVETPTLEIPVNRCPEFHVTSLDVVHSFWAHPARCQGGRGARCRQRRIRDPADRTGSFQVRCNELCGLWHGQMNTTGQVVGAERLQAVDHPARRRSTPESPSSCRPTRRPTTHNHQETLST